MDRKVKILDKALRVLFPKTYKGLINHIIQKYEYDMYDDRYEEDDDYLEIIDEREEPELVEIDEEDYKAWQAGKNETSP